jgi:hypothetical protein
MGIESEERRARPGVEPPAGRFGAISRFAFPQHAIAFEMAAMPLVVRSNECETIVEFA